MKKHEGAVVVDVAGAKPESISNTLDQVQWRMGPPSLAMIVWTTRRKHDDNNKTFGRTFSRCLRDFDCLRGSCLPCENE